MSLVMPSVSMMGSNDIVHPHPPPSDEIKNYSNGGEQNKNHVSGKGKEKKSLVDRLYICVDNWWLGAQQATLSLMGTREKMKQNIKVKTRSGRHEDDNAF